MKIYTKTGDQGQTSLLGGQRVAKAHLRIECYGTTDELNSYLGLVRDSVPEALELGAEILQIQEQLFTLGAELALAPGAAKVKIPTIQQQDIEWLEQAIDRMDASLPPLRNFVLPGGHLAVSHIHVARCIARRAERWVVQLGSEESIPQLAIPYLNRLSDYLFTLSRWVSFKTNSKESPWIPRKT